MVHSAPSASSARRASWICMHARVVQQVLAGLLYAGAVHHACMMCALAAALALAPASDTHIATLAVSLAEGNFKVCINSSSFKSNTKVCCKLAQNNLRAPAKAFTCKYMHMHARKHVFTHAHTRVHTDTHSYSHTLTAALPSLRSKMSPHLGIWLLYIDAQRTLKTPGTEPRMQEIRPDPTSPSPKTAPATSQQRAAQPLPAPPFHTRSGQKEVTLLRHQ